MVSGAAARAEAVDRQVGSRNWRWTEALATARPGGRYRVAAIRSSLTRERCRYLGCSEGEILVCKENADGVVRLERADGRSLRLERELAWFVQADGQGSPGTGPVR